MITLGAIARTIGNLAIAFFERRGLGLVDLSICPSNNVSASSFCLFKETRLFTFFHLNPLPNLSISRILPCHTPKLPYSAIFCQYNWYSLDDCTDAKRTSTSPTVFLSRKIEKWWWKHRLTWLANGIDFPSHPPVYLLKCLYTLKAFLSFLIPLSKVQSVCTLKNFASGNTTPCYGLWP